LIPVTDFKSHWKTKLRVAVAEWHRKQENRKYFWELLPKQRKTLLPVIKVSKKIYRLNK
jgi:hypothetical protein